MHAALSGAGLSRLAAKMRLTPAVFPPVIFDARRGPGVGRGRQGTFNPVGAPVAADHARVARWHSATLARPPVDAEFHRQGNGILACGDATCP
jgi:hypothetical protein